MTQPQDKMRADFEAWAKDRGYQRDELARSKLGLVSPAYFNLSTEMAWQAWQAAACAQQSAQASQDALDAARYRWLRATGETQLETEIRASIFNANYGDELDSEIDTAIAAQGASNV